MSHKHNFGRKLLRNLGRDARAVFAPGPRTLHTIKNQTRSNAKIGVYATRVVGPAASFVAGYTLGPVAGEAVGGAFAVGGGFLRAVQARNEGKSSDAQRLGRSERKRQFINNSVAAGGGAVTSAGVTAIGGGTASQTVAAGVGGQVGGPVLAGQAAPSVVGQVNPLTGTAVEQGGALATAAPGAGVNSGAMGGGFVGSYSELGLTPGTGGGFLGISDGAWGAIGGGVLGLIPSALKYIAPAGGEHIAGTDASSAPGGGVTGAGGPGEDQGGGLLFDAQGKPNWVAWGGAALAVYAIYKAVKRG